MITRDLEQITEETLIELRNNKVLEGKTIDYKQKLPSNLDRAKKEFLADVSSFANASGGELIIGVSEDKGLITSIDGLEVEDTDHEISRLENIIRDGIEPRIPSYKIQPVELNNSKYVLIIRVWQSWIGPHRVIFNKDYQFYSRNSNGKYPLDVAELRVAFNLSETITERIRNFRLDRVSKIFANETPEPFYDNAKIMLHLIPIISFNPAQSYDIDKIASHPENMRPIGSDTWNNRYNLDGFLTYSEVEEGRSCSYVQLFRSGIIEAVEGWWLRPERGKLIIRISYEQELIKSFTEYLSLLKKLSVEPPIFVFLTLLGVKGYSIATHEDFSFVKSHTIDRDILSLPEIITESYNVSAPDVLRPCFDSIWNACGFPKSKNYNDKGEWAPLRL